MGHDWSLLFPSTLRSRCLADLRLGMDALEGVLQQASQGGGSFPAGSPSQRPPAQGWLPLRSARSWLQKLLACTPGCIAAGPDCLKHRSWACMQLCTLGLSTRGV